MDVIFSLRLEVWQMMQGVCRSALTRAISLHFGPQPHISALEAYARASFPAFSPAAASQSAVIQLSHYILKYSRWPALCPLVYLATQQQRLFYHVYLATYKYTKALRVSVNSWRIPRTSNPYLLSHLLEVCQIF